MLCKIVLPSEEIIKLPSFPSSFESLLCAIRNRPEIRSSDNILLKYIDIDEELVILDNEEDLQTARLSNEAAQIKTLKVFVSYRETTPNLTINGRPSIVPSVESNGGALDTLKMYREHGLDSKASGSNRQSCNRVKSSPVGPVGPAHKSLNNDNASLTNDQLEVIDSFIGMKIQSAIAKNIQSFLPGLVNQLQTNINIPDVKNDTPQKGARGPLSCPIVRKPFSFGRKSLEKNEEKNETICNECQSTVDGNVKYVCLECPNYKCCEECEEEVEHAHPLLKVRAPVQDQQSAQSFKPRSSFDYSMFSSPEKINKNLHEGLVIRQSLSKKSCEKKPQYAGKISIKDASDEAIKTLPSQEYKVEINIKNVGTESWPDAVKLCCVNGVHRSQEEKLLALESKESQTLTLTLQAPADGGKYLSQWRLCYSEDEKQRSFGESLFIEIQVASQTQGLKAHRKSDCGITGINNNLTAYRKMRSLEVVASSSLESEQPEEKLNLTNKIEKIAEYLNDIFPGNLNEKFNFLSTLKDVQGQTIEKIVETYIVNISKNNANKSRKGGVAYRTQRHELSFSL